MKTIVSTFSKFVEWIDSQGAAFHHTDEEKRKTTILIRASFLTGFFMILYIGNCIFIDFTTGSQILPFESLLYFSLPFLIRAGLHPKVVSQLYILNGTAFGIFLVWFSGGLESPVTPWLTLMPICSILFMDARSAWIWAFIILIIIAIMGLYWNFVGFAPKSYNTSKDAIYYLNCYAGLIFIYLFLSLIFEKRLSATIKELESKKLSLEDTNNLLNRAIQDLKQTQAQLIQKEKLASLGELTAGIAHEIQNPLNFVNNFSEISKELVGELRDEEMKADRDPQLISELLSHLSNNLQKINHHGGRASSIVKGMLEHSRMSKGDKRPTNINLLADEYLKIAYHGLRAKNKDFNAELETDFGATVGLVEVVPQELGRVLLNLYNNAFYAVLQQQQLAPAGYQPTVRVDTTQVNGQVQIRVSDNGTGIPEPVKAKIFQPFFTTKPTGEGTGLGLSLSYEIVTKGHGGSLSVASNEGGGSEFVITLPV